MKKFTIFFLTIRILHVSIAQKPPLKMQLDQVENTANAVLILQTSVLDYQQQERGAVIHSDFNQIMQNRETMKKFDFTFSLIFAPVIGNNHALTYTATYNAENKTINFYELERGMYIDPNMHIYTPSRYLERYSSGFGIYTGNKKVKSVEDKFMLLLQKNKNDTISLSSLKANFIEKEQLAAQNILWKQEAKRQLEIRMQKERVTQAQAIANLQEGDKICAKHTSCDRLNQDDCLIVSAFI
jgi:regulator of replication initiation timing